jgi:hypothetical protein
MQLFVRVRGLADRMREVFVPRPEWIALDGVRDTAQLVRAIAATMPRDAVLNVVKPMGQVEAFLRSRALPPSDPARGDYYVSLADGTVADLVAAIERQAPDGPPCHGVFVSLDGWTVLEAFRRDLGEDVIWMAGDVDELFLAAFRAALDEMHVGHIPAATHSSGNGRPVTPQGHRRAG